MEKDTLVYVRVVSSGRGPLMTSASWWGWGGVLQKVLCNRQWQPQPAGHSSCRRNQSIMWLVCPPWPQLRQKLDEPRTAT